jgi:topoisomerase-4 subunit A
VLVPRSRNVDRRILMESLFKLTDLENRFSLNMNVLSMGGCPMVMGLRRCCGMARPPQGRAGPPLRAPAWPDQSPAGGAGGYLIAYLNLDEVIRIIREEDEPKAELIRTFELTDVQAEAILNMRLRSLRKLEEIEIRKEHDKLTDEKDELKTLLGSDARQWTRSPRKSANSQGLWPGNRRSANAARTKAKRRTAIWSTSSRR